MPTLPSSFWPPLNPVNYPFWNNWSLFSSASFPPSSTSSCLEKVLPLMTVLLLFKLMSFSYLLVIFSALNLWDASSRHNSNRTGFWSATMTFYSGKWNSLFLSPRSPWPLKCQAGMIDSPWKLSWSLALKTVVTWSSFWVLNYLSLSWSIFLRPPHKPGILLGWALSFCPFARNHILLYAAPQGKYCSGVPGQPRQLLQGTTDLHQLLVWHILKSSKFRHIFLCP